MIDLCECAIEIISATDDGDRLHPAHLWLVQEAANGHLSDIGLEEFNQLYEQVVAGEYVPPWFHGIKHLLIDHDGWVRWKGIVVEHYSNPWCWSVQAKIAAQDLAAQCRAIEAEGGKVTCAEIMRRR